MIPVAVLAAGKSTRGAFFDVDTPKTTGVSWSPERSLVIPETIPETAVDSHCTRV